MALGLVGKKCGMTRVFTEDGVSIPVTVVSIENNRIAQIKDVETDGYHAIQIASGSKRPSILGKAATGHFAKAKIEPGANLCEFRLQQAEDELKVGDELRADMFTVGQKVDVAGTSKGRGFSGGVRRHNFRTQDASHGNSLSHRTLGSTGNCQTPGRVFKGRKMAGQYGNARATIQNLEIVRVDAERNLLLIKGAVPGAKGGRVIIEPAVKVKESRDGA